MAIEIERKFLIKNDSWRASADAGRKMRQGYFAGPQRASIRVRIEGDSANINIKSAEMGVKRQEFEYPVPIADAEQMLNSLCEFPQVQKTRYRVTHQDHVWEIDIFEADNQGLIVAEVELEAEDEDFALPPWVGEEVSDQPRYYNVSLINHPYKDW